MTPTARHSVTRDKDKTKEQLLRELSAVKLRLAELEALEHERRHIKQTLKKAYDELEQRIEQRSAELQISEQEAYVTLQRYSQRRRQSMREIAEALILSHAIRRGTE